MRKQLDIMLSACERLGRIKCTWNPHELFLDYDGAVPRGFEQRLAFTLRTLRFKLRHYRIDRTKHGYHVIVSLEEKLEPWQTLALQAILGSDWRREALNLFRLSNMPEGSEFHRKHWNILYEYKLY